jgi:hypothetical protein
MAEQETRLVVEVGLAEALARRLEHLLEHAPHDAEEKAMLLDVAWGRSTRPSPRFPNQDPDVGSRSGFLCTSCAQRGRQSGGASQIPR